MNFNKYLTITGLLLLTNFGSFQSLLAKALPSISPDNVKQSPQPKQLVSLNDIQQQTQTKDHSVFFNQLKQVSTSQTNQSSIIPTSLYQQIKDSEEISQVTREFYLLELAKTLKNVATDDSQKALKLISQDLPHVTTVLEDSGHQQQIIAFPYNYAAHASLNHLAITQLSQKILALVQTADYPAIEMQKAFLENPQKQLAVIKNINQMISQQQAEQLLSWGLNNNKIQHEAKLVIAIKAQAQKPVLNLLQQSTTLPLQHYLPAIINLWPTAQQLTPVQSIIQNRHYASQASYYVTQLALPQQQKIQFWFQQLSNQHSGASAAHLLAQNMTSEMTDQLVTYIKATALNFPKDTSKYAQQRAVLALSLSQQAYAQSQLKQLISQQSLIGDIHQEVSQW